MPTLKERLGDIETRMAEACRRADRERASVRLVAVSKGRSAAEIQDALALGCRDFGENYVQELLAKAAEIDARFHHIGHVQTNKVKALLECRGLTLLHGVDRPKLLSELERRAHDAIDVLVQVNVSGEESKSGCAPAELPLILRAAEGCTHVRVRGLMTMPPAVDDAERVRPHFQRLRALRDEHGIERLPELSMGMSQDYEVAIEEGATLVRIGTALFGPRDD